MPPSPNLISESLLVAETIDYLVSVGGDAPVADVVEYVMDIRPPDPQIARLLALDLADKDPRIVLRDDTVSLVEPDYSAIDLSRAAFVVFDLETTGAKAPPCRITEIGAFRVYRGEVTDEFHTLVNPETPIPPFITTLTGISDAMVKHAPRFCDIAQDFLKFIGDAVLVAHNAHFDVKFLNHEVGRVYENYRVANPSLCTVQLSRRLLPNCENHKLKTVASYFSIDLVNHHRAGDDARATARIFLNLLRDLEMLGVHDLGAVKKFVSRNSYARRRKVAA